MSCINYRVLSNVLIRVASIRLAQAPRVSRSNARIFSQLENDRPR